MRFFGLLAVVAGVASLASAASLTVREDEPFNCDLAEIECQFLTAPTGGDTETIAERSFANLSNGQRLARGLHIKAPRRHSGTQIRRTEPSSVPSTTFRGIVRVDRADGTGELGYLSSHPFSGAQHRYQSIENAMIVTFSVPQDATELSQFDIATQNSDIQTTFPRLSLVQGRDNTNSDLSTGSFQYAYVAGSDPTAGGSTPQNAENSYSSATGTPRTAESSVWKFNVASKGITAVWINTDGSAATTQLFTQSTAIYAGGDSGAFVSRYPSPIIPITLTFVPL